jgi:DNA polymerase-3 subunit gamma/tau
VSSQNYLVLARKWRPQRFEDLLGQQHVAKTLANAIRSGRVAHAFLFAGVRGVGKTSAARILAKALTCRKGPTPEPCNECDACVSVTDGSAIDVQEIDGASNNSVEDVRRLRENVAYQPATLRFKIYIIDEVHMLSSSAFNALLKTLEEPPAHVKFIFATTESHKIPTTIHSRCQRYEFRRITTRQIAGRLDTILESEGIRMEAAATRIIAEEASGSMRDALSLLDQVLAAYPQGARADELAWLLGVTPRTLLARAAAAIIDRDPRAALEAVREADEAGYDLQQFARAFLHYLRDLLVLAACPDARDLTDLADAEESAARAIAARATVPHLHRLFSLASRLVDELARSPVPRVHADVALARMATADAVVPIADVLARLERLPAGREPPGGTAAPPRSGGDRPPTPASPPRAAGASWGVGAGEPSATYAQRPSRPPSESAPSAVEGPEPPPASRPSAAQSFDDEPPVDEGPPEGVREAEAIVGRAAETPTTTTTTTTTTSRVEVAPDAWERIVAEVGQGDRVLGGLLAQAVPTTLTPQLVRLAFPAESTAAELLRQSRRADALADVLQRVLGARARVEVDDTSSDAARALAERYAAQHAAEARARQEMLDHPAVREAMRAFTGSKVVDVRTGAPAGGGKGARQR